MVRREEGRTNHDSEAIDRDGALAVVLDDLVIGTLGTSTLDKRVSIALEGESILADVGPPDVLDGAGALAVDALGLI